MSSQPTRVLRYHARSVACRAPAADLAWLEEFLGPWFAASPWAEDAGAIGWTVERSDDETLVPRLLERGAPPEARAVDAFGMDSGMQQLPQWRDAEGARIVFDESLGIAYRVLGDERSETGARIEVTGPATAPKARIALMRVVRELAMSEVRAAGRLLVHGAVLGMGERGILIAGPKRAGKTTLLVHGLRAGGTLVSNDRVVLELGEAGLRAHGMPTVASIRQATLDVLPALNAELASRRYDHLSSLAEIASGQARLRPRPGRPRNLSLAQLCALLGTSPRRHAPLDTLVLLRTGTQRGTALREIPPEEAGPRLEACLFGTADQSSRLFPAPRGTAPIPSLGCREVVERVRCLDMVLGVGTSAAEIAAGLDRVLGEWNSAAARPFPSRG